jgi:hypothetical protein
MPDETEPTLAILIGRRKVNGVSNMSAARHMARMALYPTGN